MPNTFDAVKKEMAACVEDLSQEFTECYKDKNFSVSEILKFIFDAGARLVEVTEDAKGLSGPQKKELVINGVKDVYKRINPDIPFVPEPLESKLEDFVLDKGLSPFIDFIVNQFNQKGVFKKKNA